MNHYCTGYTLGKVHIDCALGANSWGEFEGGQCDHCWAKARNQECDNSYCEELGATHPTN